jgi:hypothetical protein
MYKNIIKETILSLEGAALQSAREKYFDCVADCRLDRSEPIESDEQAQAEIASDLSEALDDTFHDHTDKLDKFTELSNAAIESRNSLSSSTRKTVASSDTARIRTECCITRHSPLLNY